MRHASFPPLPVRRDARAGQRATSLALVVVLHALLLFLLLQLAPVVPPPETPVTTIVDLVPAAKEEQARARASTVKREQAIQGPRTDTPVQPATESDDDMSDFWSKVIPMTRQQMADANIARFPSRARAADRSGETGTATALASGDPGIGAGPNGEPLFNVRWHREPTQAELATYVPERSQGRRGWGMIACQTVADLRVDNCIEIAQSPRGSGLAGAVRQAAWQFRVMPPRIGSKKLVGSWVRIRIDYNVERPG
jgi:hypothetical protein